MERRSFLFLGLGIVLGLAIAGAGMVATSAFEARVLTRRHGVMQRQIYFCDVLQVHCKDAGDLGGLLAGTPVTIDSFGIATVRFQPSRNPFLQSIAYDDQDRSCQMTSLGCSH
jgi:hypothetical protein